MKAFQKILVPVDLSEHSLHALRRGLSLADALGADIDVLHVGVEPTSYAPLDRAIWGKDHAEFARLSREATRKQFEAFLAQLDPSARARSGERLEFGHAVQTIVRVAKDDGYDLIVVGTHGRTGAQHILMGSVAERVVRLAPCPVLAVR